MSQFVYLLSDSIYRTTHTNSAKNGCFLAENVDLATARVNTKKGSENYYNMFTLDKASARPLEGEHFDFNGYKGKMRLAFNTLALDFDAKDDIPKAFDDVKRFITDFSLENYQLFYSGSKGFHLYIHTSQLPALPEESDLLNKYIEKACDKLKETYLTLDSGIYTSVRKFRSPLSKHPKTGAYKIFCSVTQPLEAIQLNATTAQNLGSWMAPSIAPPNSLLNAVFEQAIGELGEVEEYNEWMNDHLNTPTEDSLSELTFAKRFNSVQNKSCIDALLSASLKSGERHEEFLRIVWALIHQGMSEQEVTKIVTPFMHKNNFEERSYELRRAFQEHRSGRPKFYQCKDKVLTAHCRSSCEMFSYLSAETKQARTHAIIQDSGSTASVEGSPENKDKTKALSEYLIVSALFNELKGSILKEGKDLFIYTGTHWEHKKPDVAKDYFMNKLDRLASKKLKYKDIVSAYNRFLMLVPTPPEGVSMFQPNPYRMNFSNGCLALDLEPNGNYRLTLNPHKREDYLIHCHKFDYTETAEEGSEFEQTLKTIWGNDKDFTQKRDAYFEILGSCLVPAFRKIVFLVGPPKSGKSTLIGVATKLVHRDYLCSVSPMDFRGFNTESMINKLVNFDTDLTLSRPLQDEVLKKVEDAMPIRMQRKGFSDVYSPIPGIHLFGMNKLPKSNDGVEAYDRRVIILTFSGGAIGDDYIKDYHAHLWTNNGSWIVAKAIEGLKRLASNGGRFTQLESSKEVMEEWKDENKDFVEQMLADIQEQAEWEISTDKSTTLSIDFSGKVERKLVWAFFRWWAGNYAFTMHSVRDIPGKHAFFIRMAEKGCVAKKSDGVYSYENLTNSLNPSISKTPFGLDKSEY